MSVSKEYCIVFVITRRFLLAANVICKYCIYVHMNQNWKLSVRSFLFQVVFKLNVWDELSRWRKIEMQTLIQGIHIHACNTGESSQLIPTNQHWSGGWWSTFRPSSPGNSKNLTIDEIPHKSSFITWTTSAHSLCYLGIALHDLRVAH